MSEWFLADLSILCSSLHIFKRFIVLDDSMINNFNENVYKQFPVLNAYIYLLEIFNVKDYCNIKLYSHCDFCNYIRICNVRRYFFVEHIKNALYNIVMSTNNNEVI